MMKSFPIMDESELPMVMFVANNYDGYPIVKSMDFVRKNLRQAEHEADFQTDEKQRDADMFR